MSEPRHDELAERMLDIGTAPPGHATFREPDLSADEWRSAYFVLAGIAQKKIAECYAARPRTELNDVLRLSRVRVALKDLHAVLKERGTHDCGSDCHIEQVLASTGHSR